MTEPRCLSPGMALGPSGGGIRVRRVTDRDDDERMFERALFRYRLIADAIESPKSARGALLRAVAAEEHSRPDGKRVRVSLRTLERWVRRYEEKKLAGLMRALAARARRAASPPPRLSG